MFWKPTIFPGCLVFIYGDEETHLQTNKKKKNKKKTRKTKGKEIALKSYPPGNEKAHIHT